jgi:hypothetical protein
MIMGMWPTHGGRIPMIISRAGWEWAWPGRLAGGRGRAGWEWAWPGRLAGGRGRAVPAASPAG